MKKFYVSLLILLVSFSVRVQSQVYELNVRNIQNFEHPIMETNDAIKQNKMVYIDAGTTNSKHVFDLDKMKLYRNAEGVLGEFDIVEKYVNKTIFDVMVKFTNGQFAKFTYQKEPNGFYTLYCRWIENDKMNGWFDPTLK